MSDFRANRMPSPEGIGNAKKAFQSAWAKYAKALEPITGKVAQPITENVTFDLLGFWVMWQLLGGFEGLQKPISEGGLGMSRSAVYRRVSMFRKALGSHPDEFKLSGVTIDVEAYLKDWAAKTDTPKKG